MQKLIAKYGLAAHLALLAVAPQFFSLSATVWLAALSACWLFLEPSRLGQESLSAARQRVLRSVVSDPLFWIMLLLTLVAAVRMANGGVGPWYDAEGGEWIMRGAAVGSLPGCVDGAGRMEFAACLAILVVLQGCRNALGRGARCAFLLGFSAISGVAAVVECIKASLGDRAVLAAMDCSFSNPSYSGVYFGIALLAGISAFSVGLQRGWYRSLFLFVFAVAGNAAGLFVFSPPVVTLVFVSAAFLLVAYSAAWNYVASSSGEALVFLVGVVGFLVAAAGLTMAAAPSGVIAAKLAPFFGEAGFLPKEFFTVHDLLSRLSLDMWKAHPWLGAGLGSFADGVRFIASPEDLAAIPAQQVAPYGMHWMVLAERGSIGAFLILAPLAVLAASYVRRAVSGVAAEFPPPSCFAGLLVLPAAVLESLAGVSLLAPGAMTAFMLLFSVAASSFAKVKPNV